MLRQAPLLATDRGERLFVPPSGYGALVAYVRRGYNVLLVADRGEGKTTVLHQLERERALDVEEEGRPPSVFINLASAEDPLGALESIIGGAQEATGQGISLDESSLPTAFGADRSVRLRLRQLEQMPACCFLLDNANPRTVAHPLFGEQRDRLWELEQHQFVLTANRADRQLALRPPADAFWEQVVHLELTETQAVEVIERGLDQKVPWAHQLVGAVGTNLRRLIQAVQEIGAGEAEPPSGTSAWELRHETIANLSRPAAMVFAELEGLGEVSAADKQLVERVGYSKTSVFRALEELERKRLVSSEERADGPGRPRKVYSLAR